MSKIKGCFVSRFGEQGVVLQADFSQLEVIGVAHLSGDLNMREDIESGVDSHSQSASWLHPEYTYEEILAGYEEEDKYFTTLRKNAKAPRFQLQYGAGAPSIAEMNGLSLEQAKGFIEQYYQRYWRLKEWQDQNIEIVKASRKPTRETTARGIPRGKGELVSETGRRYVFTEYDSPDWMQDRGIFTSFSPTEIKNYPSQGFATGDIVPMVIGELFYNLKAHENLKHKALLVNTIHDSVMLDVHKEVLEAAARVVKNTLESAPKMLKDKFDIYFDLPLKCEIEVGANWADMVRYNV